MVGVAVIGPGRAGRARIAALDGHPRATLRAVVGREPALGEPSFEDVLSSSTIDAVLICTPNALHASMARAVVEAGKHVAVEFPLAPDAVTARDLFARARADSNVLHVEHIELLSPSQLRQRERASQLGALVRGRLTFRGGLEGWIGDLAQAGSPALRALARLHRLWDLFGPARLGSAKLESGGEGYHLSVCLEFEAGGEVELVEERRPGLARATRWALELEGGRLDDPPPEPAGGLFATDLDVFLARIEHEAESYVSDERELEVLELVGAIEARVGGAAG